MNDSRTSLRKGLLSERSSLTPDEHERSAARLVDNVVATVPDTPGCVAGYVAHGGELDVRPALDALIERQWRVSLPICGPDASMEFGLWEPGDLLRPNRYGIGEPTTDPLPLEHIDVVLVPGVGFDVSGARVGHGVGYYDRFFARCIDADLRPLKLGVAHDLQIVDLPEPEPWDIAMDRILTPTKVLNISPCA